MGGKEEEQKSMASKLSMDVARVIPYAAVLAGLQLLINLFKEHKKLKHKVTLEMENLLAEVELIKEDLKSYNELELHELLCDIEDFSQSLWIPEASGPVLSVVAMDPRENHLESIKFFLKKIEDLAKRREKIAKSKPEASRSEPASSSAAVGGYAREESLVGIAEPKKVLLDLLKKPSSGDAGQKPKVLSIVGCPGVGKTALARVLYNHACASHEFDCIAWVEAAECNSRKALQNKILEMAQADLASRSWNALDPLEGGGNASSPNLRAILAQKRYLVFIDDLQHAKVLKDTVNDLPLNGKGSVLVVTTSVHSVADICSSGSHVYAMQRLSEKHSKELFWNKVYYGRDKLPSEALVCGSKSIISKCDGLPLALITVAEHLSLKTDKLDSTYINKVGEELGSHYLAGTKAQEEFGELRRVLGKCYDDLPGYEDKTCMLSLSIYPSNHRIRVKSLVRKIDS